MPNIIDILARALSLRQETELNSITPNRAGGIMYDTLLVLNQMQLEGGALLISKVYASVAAMEADTTPTSDLTGRALKPGQLVVIVTTDTSASDMGSEYRYNGPGSWTYVGKVGGLPFDTVPTESSTKGITSGGVYTALMAMKNEGYKYMGIATPGDGGTSPGTPHQPVFYVAGPGSYPNFGSLTVAAGYLGFIKYSGASWSVDSVAVGKDYDSQLSTIEEQITQLEAEVNGAEGWADVELTLDSAKYYQYVAATNRIKVASQELSMAACARISVNPGDKFNIFGFDKATAESVTRLWCFSNGTIVTVDGVDYYSALEVAADKINTRGTGAVITAPEGAAYLTICFQSYDATQDKLQKWQKIDNGLVGDIADLEERVEELEAQNIPQVVDDLNSTSKTDALSANQGHEIGKELYGDVGYADVDLELTADSYYNCMAGSVEPYTVKTTPTSYPNSGMYCAQIEVQAGERFKIYGKGNSQSTALYAFADSSNLLLVKATNNVDYRTGGHEFTAPENAVRLVINFKEYDSATDKLQKWGVVEPGLVDRVDSLEDAVEVLEEAITTQPKSVIDGKNILVFGDSLVEFTGRNDGKTWCQHAAEISGATFINIGIGGTRLSSRVPMAHIFDASKTYSVDDYVYYLTSGHYHFYRCTQQHTGVWDASHFVEVTDAKMYVGLDVVNLVTMACDTNTSIETRFADAEAAADCVKTNIASHDDNTGQVERLKGVDFATVDAIMIMAGTNDYANAFGNADSAIITEENGAINAIVGQLSTAFGTIPTYFIKEPVKWFSHTVEGETVYTDDYWCDVYTRNNMTLTEYFDKIEEQFKIINHIPVCDLYYGLGWNKQNFWNFFGIQLDGTHPYYGFRIVAEKIVNFVIANKIF